MNGEKPSLPRETSPLLSVVLAAPDGFDSIRKTLSHLGAQTAWEALEIIVVGPSCEEAHEALKPFAKVQVIEARPLGSIGAANALGVRQASAPIVALAEDHCFPEPGWAAALIEAHQGEWAAVGPGVRNANPGSAVSWADFFIGYGPWMLPATTREMDFLPGHISSYKREILLRYGDRLKDMLDAETLLHWDLREQGYRLLLQQSAVVAHTNFSLWKSFIPIQFYAGRVFAGHRIQGMPFWKRSIYVMGSPLIPWVRLSRVARQALRGQQLGRFLLSLHALAIGLGLDGLGQLVGYLFGPGKASDRVEKYEYRRIDHITSSDRQQLYQQD